ncbi:MAG TPA: hypothetical protein VGU20_26080 [Stellaceae bacterium]|nr:hypothetical protein [Stellaceae bacterium]
MVDFAPSNPETWRELPPVLQELIRAGASLLTFNYTAGQWAAIDRAIQSLQPDRAAIEETHHVLLQAARRFYLETLNGPGRRQQTKWELQHWTKVRDLSAALMKEFFWLAHDGKDDGPPDPPGHKREPYKDQLLALMTISVMATSGVNRLGGKIDDGYPMASPKAHYQSDVLSAWTKLGGKLKISRHPLTGKTKGPLSRYFSAVTEPVYGGSPESLHAIVKRHGARETALAEWRLQMIIANGEP